MPTTAPARRKRRSGPLAAPAATFAALDRLLIEHPELPEVSAWQWTAEGVSGSPYLPTRPCSALRAWVAVLRLGAPVGVTRREAIAGAGSELVAVTRIADRPLILTVVTWRHVEPNGLGLVSGPRLDRLAALEEAGLGQPLDPATIGGGLPIAEDPGLSVPPLPRRLPALPALSETALAPLASGPAGVELFTPYRG